MDESEQKDENAPNPAGSIDLKDALITDAASAAGVGAGLVSTHGRQRQPMRIIMKNLNRIPVVGDRIIRRNHQRIPESSDGHPVSRVMESGYDGDDAQDVLLTVRRQVDPAMDRMLIT